MKRLVFPLLAVLACSGCVSHRSSPMESYDELSGLGHAEQVRNLAAAVSERISIRYPQALVYVEDPEGNGMFGDALRYALGRNHALAMRKEMANISVMYALGELNPGTGYLNLQFSDGTAMAQSFSVSQPVSEDILPLEAPRPVQRAAWRTTENRSFSPPAEPHVRPAVLPSVTAQVQPYQQANPALQTESAPSPAPAALPPGNQNRPLREAVLHNLQRGWKYTIPDERKREIRVSWPEDASWRKSISVAAEQAGCRAEFDEAARRVRIGTVSATPGHARVVEASSDAPASSEVQRELASMKTFRTVKPEVFSPPAETEWELSPGSLEEQLREWCAKADWQLLWKAEHDIRLQAHSVMRGDFEKAVTGVFQALHTQGNSLRATLYKTNSVLEIKDN